MGINFSFNSSVTFSTLHTLHTSTVAPLSLSRLMSFTLLCPTLGLTCIVLWVSITKAFRDQTSHVYGSTCPGVIAGRSMKTTVNYEVSNSKRHSRLKKKNLYTQAHLQWALTEGDWFITSHVSCSKSWVSVNTDGEQDGHQTLHLLSYSCCLSPCQVERELWLAEKLSHYPRHRNVRNLVSDFQAELVEAQWGLQISLSLLL